MNRIRSHSSEGVQIDHAVARSSQGVAAQSNPEDEPGTRGARVRYAMDGLQRFKQSWKSVMLLKAGVGLGQVIALIVLLILANTLSSPLFPSQTQSEPNDVCPHPHLFQSWMGVQIARLTICWSVSCWMCIRAEKRRRRRRLEREQEATEADDDVPVPSDPPITQHPPSLVHSTSTTSTATLAAIATPSSVPNTPRTSQFASSSRLDLSCVLELDHIPDVEERSDTEPVKSCQSGRLYPPPSQYGVDGLSVIPPGQSLRERRSMRSLRQARDMLHGETPIPAPSTFPAWMDKHASSISRTLGIISTVLFILGNILLFYPPPSDQSCYSANPMLWWGVLLVTAVGWVLLLQVFFVVVIVGLGGAVVLNALRRLGVIPAPVEPESPRAAQPDPLTPAELAEIKIVCYLPVTESGDTSTLVTRLPFPPVYLPPHQSTCAICQADFEVPKEGRTILLKADKLRQLRCSHVYHMDCIDQWLLRGSGNCPSCNAPVRSTEPTPELKSHRRSIFGRQAPQNPA